MLIWMDHFFHIIKTIEVTAILPDYAKNWLSRDRVGTGIATEKMLIRIQGSPDHLDQVSQLISFLWKVAGNAPGQLGSQSNRESA